MWSLSIYRLFPPKIQCSPYLILNSLLYNYRVGWRKMFLWSVFAEILSWFMTNFTALLNTFGDGDVLSLRGECGPGDFGESAIDKDRPGAKLKKKEKVRGLVWARLLIPKNTRWSYVLCAKERVDCPRTLMVLMFAEDAEGLDLLKKDLKSWKRWKIENK